MSRLFPAILAGTVAALLPVNYVPSLSWPAPEQAAPAALPQSNVASKGDRVRIMVASVRSEPIATIEIEGFKDPAVVYRTRDGRELFRNDPGAGVTIISKGLVLPEVTVRERKSPVVRTLPPEPTVTPAQATRQKPVRPTRTPVGCEPLFSPLTQHPSVGLHTGRCMADAGAPVKLAAAL